MSNQKDSCYICGGEPYKTDGQSRTLCYRHAMGIGEIEIIKITKQQGRNEPCKCGSGKKFKKCCLLK